MIVTGFLGAGKTTFINNVLLQNEGVKIGLIENEFGDTSIDSMLITDYKPESIIELNNGCICCTIFNEFAMTLQELIRKHDHLEQLIIETTGIADPAPIIAPFYEDAELNRLFELSGTICLVDSVNFSEHIAGIEQQKQIILSDMIVLNKVNDVNLKTLANIRNKLAALNKTAMVIETDYSRVEPLHLYQLQPDLQDEFIRKLRKPFFSEPENGGFHSFTIRFGGFINETRFRDWFKYFASLHRKEVFRIKGMINFENNPLIGIVQSVGGMISVSEGSVHNPYAPLENVLVFIGKDISKYQIEKEIQEFLVQKDQPERQA
ncbi:MAG: GTP-binding protein, partial [Bacteroidota bacterium]|nr:GTP-binding protein [Bacteroidota bacterium]